jgi:prepilin-type N-terminal cleavage/methylation domain-containing protein
MIYKKGFTILELLVVLAIIGIFASIAVVMLGNSRGGAKVAAFKSEVDSLVPLLISICHDRAIVASDVPTGSSYAALAEDPGTQDCGPNSAVTFSIDISSSNGAACTSATITELGATYSPSGC